MTKKILFVIQGEGRGHMTQALALKSIIEAGGHQLCGVIVGSSHRRKLPDFFIQKIGVPVTELPSPNFATDKKNKSVRILPSVIQALRHLPEYIRSLRQMRDVIRREQPDLVMNFYEPLLGLYYTFYRPAIPMVCIGHQFLLQHSRFQFPKGFTQDRIGLKAFTKLVSARAKRKLALSFYPFEDDSQQYIYVVPPLLREAVHQQNISQGNYLLLYLLNQGYSEDIIRWHRENPEIELHCFTDRQDIHDMQAYDKSLFFHRLNDRKFLEMMAGCRGLVTTAGFESVCEALYMGKPVYMVPVAGHFEQYCNSRDAAQAGAGMYGSDFQLDRFMDYLPTYVNRREEFQAWAGRSAGMILTHLHAAMGIAAPSQPIHLHHSNTLHG